MHKMSPSNNTYVNKGLTLLQEGLYPYVEMHLKSRFGSVWQEKVTERSKDTRAWDSYGLLKVMNSFWNEVFTHLQNPARSYVNETVFIRNKWARQEEFNQEDADRALDTMRRLLISVSNQNHADQINDLRKEMNTEAEKLPPTTAPRILRDLRPAAPPPPPPPPATSPLRTAAGRKALREENRRRIAGEQPPAPTPAPAPTPPPALHPFASANPPPPPPMNPSSDVQQPSAPPAPPVEEKKPPRQIKKNTVKEIACELLCETIESDGQQVGMSFATILAKVRERLPNAKTSDNSLNCYMSHIRKGKHGFDHWTGKLPARRLKD